MTREERVVLFFYEHPHFRAHWCTARVCACMGCVNKYPKKKEWYLLFLDEPYLTKEDIDQYTARRKIKP